MGALSKVVGARLVPESKLPNPESEDLKGENFVRSPEMGVVGARVGQPMLNSNEGGLDAPCERGKSVGDPDWRWTRDEP
jgi:hypothetical protein